MCFSPSDLADFIIAGTLIVLHRYVNREIFCPNPMKP
jgi:hypothetical protein